MKFRKLFIFLFTAGLIGAFTGCETTQPQATGAVEPKRQYHTFTVLADPTAGPASDPGAPGRLREIVLETVTSALVAKGYIEAPPASADLLVHLHAEFRRDLLSETTEQRKLTIEISDQHSKKQVWIAERGRSASLTMPPDEVRKRLVEMLAPFPAATAVQ